MTPDHAGGNATVRADVGEPARTAINLVAGQKTSGELVLEEVLVTREGAGRFRIEATPGLVLGVARGDVIVIDTERSFTVVERGGNLAIHVYGPHHLVDEVTEAVRALGGSLDGHAPGLTAFTVPVAAGFVAVETLFDRLVTPLRWRE